MIFNMFDMKTKKIGFIGGGNMSYAVAMGIVKGGGANPQQILISNRSKEKLNAFSTEGMNTTLDNIEVLSKCDVVVLGVKPYVFPIVADEISLAARDAKVNLSNKLFVSLMGGVTINQMEEAFGTSSKIIRTMPNTPCVSLAGTVMMVKNKNVKDDEYTAVKNLLSSCAGCYDCSEKDLSPASAVMGCAPAYFYVAIEALADGAVMHGLPRPLAIELAARAAMGAGKVVLESGKHPEKLKDEVASPAGTTIRGLYALEKGGFRASLIDACVAVCTPKKS